MTLLQQLAGERLKNREEMRGEMTRSLRLALCDLLPRQGAVIFGSLVKPGAFSDVSDIDLALWHEPSHMSIFQLSSLLAERLGRGVDVVLLPECRFRERILREGKAWTPPD